MFSRTVTDKDGNQRQVVGDDKKALAEAAKAVEAQRAPVAPNIDIPVRKGFDMVDFSADTGLVDGTGAHNSPRSAVADDGHVEGNKDVPFVVATPQGGVAMEVQKLDKDGELSDLTAADEAKAAKANVAERDDTPAVYATPVDEEKKTK